ncbi:carbohydrate ABC transporter permease [Paenibacillus eucommiae]|uniref:ABC-type sugar transport system permease subunit n=1 Tax=Paenibacillus eucommiae TaxID=1355755 RepID=A0ABS4IS82_9BACL|nr:sugar ABC transporter permease [Paenibacillus eucommiae]MBP1989444.1 ABC-type sugar transport system permease subunit [Paenibacillus eucommiae]
MSKQERTERNERRRGYWSYRWKDYSTGYLFMLPWAIGFAVFVAFPVGWSFFNSFNSVRLTGAGFTYTWVGLDNFRRVLMEDNVYPIKLVTYFQEMLLIIPLILIFSFFVSLLLNQKMPGRAFIRAIFFLPVIFATGQVLMELFGQGAGKLPFIEQYNLEGLLRQYMGPRLAEPMLNVLSRAVIILWYSGVQILIFIAGYQTIPRSVYEAIRIDGATPWESFWKITLPAMVPFIGLNAVFTIVDLFTFPFNPVLEQVRVNMFHPQFGYGYASAQAWIYFALILVLLGIALGLTYRSVVKRGAVVR